MKPFNVICRGCPGKLFFAGCLSFLISAKLFSQIDGKVFIPSVGQNAKPFDKLPIVRTAAGTIVVKDKSESAQNKRVKVFGYNNIAMYAHDKQSG